MNMQLISLKELIANAEDKTGSKAALARALKIQRPRLYDYIDGNRPPDDIIIGRLAEIVGGNPIETICIIKKEIEPENAEIWDRWYEGFGKW
ncbi:hypothetical protein, partial [Psychrobacter alimentarius]|uniref:hypothetical protein n=1 Tax=Psychrobacter alimentarius TaxID=261164 RepID=UPI003FD2C927